MFSALAKAFGQLSDPAFRRVLIRSVLAALVVFIAVWVAAWLGLSWVGEALSGWLAAQEPGGFWVEVAEWVFGAAGIIGVLVASFFLFPGVMVLAMAFLLEDVAAAVERRHYPELPPARGQPLGEAVMGALAFAAVMLLLNLLALPFYLLLLFVPPLNLFVFYLLNGYLLGREYFELVALRRVGPDEARRIRKMHRGKLFLTGVVMTLLLTLPVVNLLAPVVITAAMVHLFEDWRKAAASA